VASQVFATVPAAALFGEVDQVYDLSPSFLLSDRIGYINGEDSPSTAANG
jgi:hypothetical protein